MSKAKTKAPGIPVSRRAVIARINRKLRSEDEHEQFVATRGTQARIDLGDYYTINHRFNGITGKHLDPEQYARDLGVLKPFERMEG